MSNASQEDLPGRFITTPIQARFVDTDALGHVNNAVLVSYTEIGRVDLFNRVRQRMGNLILARVAIDFERQVKLLDEISVKTRITRFGTTSMTVEQWIMAGDERAARAEVVVVHFDYKTQAPSPIPQEWRTQLLDPPAPTPTDNV
jgi:acyl-CoA thioester hydrolase